MVISFFFASRKQWQFTTHAHALTTLTCVWLILLRGTMVEVMQHCRSSHAARSKFCWGFLFQFRIFNHLINTNQSVHRVKLTQISIWVFSYNFSWLSWKINSVHDNVDANVVRNKFNSHFRSNRKWANVNMRSNAFRQFKKTLNPADTLWDRQLTRQNIPKMWPGALCASYITNRTRFCKIFFLFEMLENLQFETGIYRENTQAACREVFSPRANNRFLRSGNDTTRPQEN